LPAVFRYVLDAKLGLDGAAQFAECRLLVVAAFEIAKGGAVTALFRIRLDESAEKGLARPAHGQHENVISGQQPLFQESTLFEAIWHWSLRGRVIDSFVYRQVCL